MQAPLETLIAVQKSLTPELLHEPYRSAYTASNPTAGHCYVASEALWHLLDGWDGGWRPMVGRDPDGGTHWWLEAAGGYRADPTADQYLCEGLEPPYAAGRRCGFLTKQPSKRAAVVIDRALALLENTMALADHAADIIESYAAFAPVPLIAKDYGVSRIAIYRFIDRHAPDAKLRREEAKKRFYAEIADCYAKGEPVAQLAEAYSLSAQRIYEIIKAQGVSRAS
ncbi:hypothetical protein phiCbK_198 [Caulobacter phage phiCbK]|uniref:Uncharacterized protein n=5 Tax=Viruses TaxID=10239 RepID=J3U9M8_9CAUD|nr:hypothetical protein D865_gp296 [Caulobacter phage phiCbK]AFO71713.1 hypothetical protein phiCbK_198 [Caulobacter phage phiCbK]AFU86954.1 hypothetical protein CbK_gp122 [Caulobacter phage phiCbK]ARB15036.1 hypothetical protein Ccr32_gp118 [Caulobacter phage Ccr32]ARB15368.1 hypothetical protein Ccr34_gp126 [Caulobacter phage Ccr34]